MGDTDLETMANVTIAEYDYEDEAFDNVSEAAKDFIDSLLVKEKERRATADECLAHPWLAGQLMAGSSPASFQSSPLPEEEKERERKGSLNAAKQNLASHKEHWEEQKGAHEFIFDR